MLEVYGNFWNVPDAFGHVITTNGTLRSDGKCVMGRGVALQATHKLPRIAKILGDLIKEKGNNVHYLGPFITSNERHYNMFSFPVKNNWWEKASLELIEYSCKELVTLVLPKRKIVMVRPGCGNGNLSWKDVKPICEQYLDDNFVIVERKGREHE